MVTDALVNHIRTFIWFLCRTCYIIVTLCFVAPNIFVRHRTETTRTSSKKADRTTGSSARTGPTKGLEGVGELNKNRKRERQILLKILKGKAHAMSDKNVYYCVSVLCSIYYRDECLPRAFASHGYIIYHMAHNFESSADQ